jgi:anti-sigma factor RsiW
MGVSEHREEHLDLCAAYALGTLDEAGRRELEAHLAEGCPQCEAALADFGAATVLLAASSARVEPSPALKGKVMAAIRRPVHRARRRCSGGRSRPRRRDVAAHAFLRS